MTNATPAPLPHPSTPTPTWSTPAPKTDIPPLPSATIKALKEAATLKPINVMSFYMSLLAPIRSHHRTIAALLDLPPPAWKSILTYDLVMAAASQWLANVLLDIIVRIESSPYVS